MRQEGYYWVSVDGDEPQVGLWETGVWCLAGNDEGYADDEGIKILSERLTPPAWTPPAEDDGG